MPKAGSAAEPLPEEATIEEILASLEVLSPGAGAYLGLYLEMISEFETAPYTENPSLVSHCFPQGLDDDQAELVCYLSEISEEKVEELRMLMDNLQYVLRNQPVLLWSISCLKKFCSAQSTSPIHVAGDINKRRYSTPNILYTRNQQESLFRKLGFKHIRDKGKGVHEKWHDPITGYSTTSIESGTLWVKNIVRELVKMGLSLERIKVACDELKIEFKILD